jgi:hypothetical protein
MIACSVGKAVEKAALSYTAYANSNWRGTVNISPTHTGINLQPSKLTSWNLPQRSTSINIHYCETLASS